MTWRRLLAIAGLLGILGLWVFSDRLFPLEILSGPNVRVRDGDTLELRFAGGVETIRLTGIDAPEYHQTCRTAANVEWPCGRAARAQLEALALVKPLSCTVEARDQYHRKVSTCATPATPDIGGAMVASGLAISPDERGTARYAAEQDAARGAHRGLWQGAFQPPAEWRAAHPRS
ncbi:MAG: thermonuclease family protein [Sphingopyxis sp.]